MADPGMELATRVREHVEASARAQCTPGEIAAALWASGLVTDRVQARQTVAAFGDDLVAWKLAGRREFRVAAYNCSVGNWKLSPGQAAAQAEWGKQHAKWTRREVDQPSEAAEAGAAGRLKVAGT